MAVDRQSVCVWRQCHLPLDAGHQLSPGLPREDEQPQPCTLPCLHQSPAAASEVVVGISSSSSTSCWKWASGSCPGCWEASLLTPGLPKAASTAPSLPLALPCAAARMVCPGFASSPGAFRGQQNSILLVLLRSPHVTFHVPSHKLLRQNV